MNERLRQIFDQICDKGQYSTSESESESNEFEEPIIRQDGLRRLLLDNDIDESLAAPMFKLIGGWKSDGITCDQFQQFCTDMEKKDINLFYKYLFDFFDSDNDKQITETDLVEISKLFGDNMQLDEAEAILTDSKILDYDNFVNGIQNVNSNRQ